MKRLKNLLAPTDQILIDISSVPLHIGKSSCGWTFSFQATEHYKSYKELLEFYENNKKLIEIKDEYGNKVKIEEFKELVERKRKEPNNYYHCMHKEYPNDDFGDYLDDEGNSFSKLDFS